MDFLIEFFLEIYMELMFLIVPEEKRTQKKIRVIAFLLAIFVLVGVFALVIWGLTLIIDKDNLLGIIPLAFAVILSVIQIVAGCILYSKNHSNN